MTRLPKYVKPWCTRGTGRDGTDEWFMLKARAVERAKSVLVSKKKRVVRIGHITEKNFEKYKNDNYRSLRDTYEDVEKWQLVSGIPKMVR